MPLNTLSPSRTAPVTRAGSAQLGCACCVASAPRVFLLNRLTWKAQVVSLVIRFSLNFQGFGHAIRCSSHYETQKIYVICSLHHARALETLIDTLESICSCDEKTLQDTMVPRVKKKKNDMVLPIYNWNFGK